MEVSQPLPLRKVDREVETNYLAEVVWLDDFRPSSPITKKTWEPYLAIYARLQDAQPDRITPLEDLIDALPQRRPQDLEGLFSELVEHETPVVRRLAAERLPLIMNVHPFLAAGWLKRLLADTNDEVVSDAQISTWLMAGSTDRPGLATYLYRALEYPSDDE